VAVWREPMDVFIDAVIAWESLFGTTEGEPTFRVTTCLAALLEDDPARRVELKSQLGKIYALRSKVVHGSGDLKASEYPRCQALEVAIRAVRNLLADRNDLLRISDTAVRSATLLLGA
jgi:Apea-like HEPN